MLDQHMTQRIKWKRKLFFIDLKLLQEVKPVWHNSLQSSDEIGNDDVDALQVSAE